MRKKKPLAVSPRLMMAMAVIVGTVVFSSASFTGQVVRQGLVTSVDYAAFASCLAEKETVLYLDSGETSARQLAMFSGGADYLFRVNCDVFPDFCAKRDVRILPSWDILGNRHAGLIPLGELADITGCRL